VILAVAEARSGALNRATWEAVAAAHEIALVDPTAGSVVVALPSGSGPAPDPALRDLAAARADEILVVESPALETYAADAYVAALAAVVAARGPDYVVFPHTYQARDFVPALAARLDCALVTDVTGVATVDGRCAFARPMFQGRLAASVVPDGPRPFLITVQAAAFLTEDARGETPPPATRLAVSIDPAMVRQQPEAPFREARQAVDLSKADRIVAVGRGIRDAHHVALAQDLAKALGAELGASRPVCDSGWVPMDRQIGSSGQTVAPKIYVALGVSGAIQHLVGMKGSAVVVAINKDPDAPIFEIADYGIVGDLFEIVPEILKALEA
jgi:electron transfer flavoprotein alpha subunit